MFVHIITSNEEEYVYPFVSITREKDTLVFMPKDFKGSTEDLLKEASIKFNTVEDAKRVFELALYFMDSDSVVFDIDLNNYFKHMKYVRAKLDAMKKG